jgi:DNA-binding transcriptional MocR family regulator
VLDLEQSYIIGTTAREIATSAEAAIRDGLIETGAQLPTVRALADRLGTSPATVNAAYRVLRQRGLIVADGRRGTRVATRPTLRTPLHQAVDAATKAHIRDLSVGMPDPSLLPDLGPALARLDVERTRLDGLETSDAELLELARRDFRADGVASDAIAIVGGAFDGIERALGAHLRPGDRVIVEDPSYPAIRDLLLALGLVPIPVGVDHSGPLPEPFAAGLSRGAEAAVLVTRAQNPAGAALTPERASELRSLLERHPGVLVIEDDHAGPVAGAPFIGLASDVSSRWAVIRSVSKFLHPDLRLAMMAGDQTTIARLEGRQAVGTRWVSHLLQALVADMLAAPEFGETAARARDAYTERRRQLIDALAARGIPAHGRSGLNVWIPVREEGPVSRALLDAGWLVRGGEPFRFQSAPGIRVTITTLRPGEAEGMADVIASVEHAGRRRGAY